MKVLLVDDEPIELENLQHILSNDPVHKWQTVQAKNGYEALEILKIEEADVAFLDIRMPGLNGLELARILKNQHPAMELIILSAYGEFGYAQEAIRNGVFRYLLKPAVPADVLDVLNDALQRVNREKRREQMFNQWRELHTAETAEPKSEERTGCSQIVHKCIEYMKVHYAQPLSLAELAEALYVHPSYLSRLFRKETGTNYIDFLTKIRLYQAKKLLLQTDWTIDRIAEQVGFNSSSYFSVSFKKMVGVSPTTFRLNGRKIKWQTGLRTF